MTRWIDVRKFIWLRQVRPHPCLYRHVILRKVFAFGFLSNIILCDLSVSLCLSLSLSLSVCLSVCMPLSLCLSFCLSDFLSLCLWLCLSVCLSVCLSLSLSQHYRETNRLTVMRLVRGTSSVASIYLKDLERLRCLCAANDCGYACAQQPLSHTQLHC